MNDEFNDMDYEIERQEFEISQREKHLQSLPKLLFKFKSLNSITDLDRLADVLKPHRLYMPNYEQLNDPLDGTNARLLGAEETIRDEREHMASAGV